MNRRLRTAFVALAFVGLLAGTAVWIRSRAGYPRTVWARVAPTHAADVELCAEPDGDPLGNGCYAPSPVENDRSVHVVANPGFCRNSLDVLLRRLGFARRNVEPADYRPVGGSKRTALGDWREFELVPPR